jgi:enoyl-CoA hydratase/carnithine racemase
MNGVEPARGIPVPPTLDATSSLTFLEDVRAAQAADERVIVLEGRDGVFCRGLDPSCMRTSISTADLRVFVDALLALRRMSKTVIAAVDGVALGGGLGLAAAADVVVATETSTFGLPEAQLGLVPAIIMPFLLERMRLQQCRLWALSPHARGASEAAQAGLVDVITTRGDFTRHVRYWIRQTARAHPRSVFDVKRLTSWRQEGFEASLHEGVALTSTHVQDGAPFAWGADDE